MKQFAISARGVAHSVWSGLRGFGPLPVATVAWVAAVVFGPRHGSREYFEVASQVIPVLLLALGLQARLLGLLRINALRDAVRVLVVSMEAHQARLDDLEKLADDVEDATPEQLADVRSRLSGARRSVEYFPGIQAGLAQVVRVVWVQRTYALASVLVVALGELSALNTLAHKSYGHASAKWSYAAIVFALVAVSTNALRPPAAPDPPSN